MSLIKLMLTCTKQDEKLLKKQDQNLLRSTTLIHKNTIVASESIRLL